MLTAGLFCALFIVGCGEPPIAESLKHAQEKIDAGKTAEGIKNLEELFAKHPKDTSVMEALAFAQFNNGDAARAGELFNQLGLNQTPDDHLYAAQAYRKAGQNDKAIESYRLYLLGEPMQAQPWNDLGELLIMSGKATEGISALAKANDLAPTPELALRIGILYEEAGNSAQAQRYLQSALKQARSKRTVGAEPAPIEGDILAELAELGVHDRNPLEAKRHVKQLERDFPKHARLKNIEDKIAPLEEKAQDKIQEKGEEKKDEKKEDAKVVAKEAVKLEAIEIKESEILTAKVEVAPDVLLMEALNRDPKDAARWIALAQIKEKQGDDEWAEAAYLEAMRLKPADASIIIPYLTVVKERRSPSEYLQEAQRQLDKYPELPELYLMAARDYRDAMQNKRNASIIFKKFLKKFPEHAEAPKVKAELEALQK
jgi:Tfp pilus assembly protein PilF